MALKIRPLERDRASELLDYLSDLDFGHAPHWATCFCQFYHLDCSMAAWKDRSGEDNRKLALANIESGKMQGYLAYWGDQVIGWLNVNDIQHYDRIYNFVKGDLPQGTWGLPICYVIHPQFRRQGVAKALLKRALSDYRAMGFTGLVAMPILDSTSSPELLYRGSLGLYEQMGFRMVMQHGNQAMLAHSFEGDVGYESHEIDFSPLSGKRRVRLWLPPGYRTSTKRYPVIYMHDGQNLFNRHTAAYGAIWDAHLAVESLMDQHPDTFEGAIIVGIDNAEGLKRLDEYSPWESPSAEVLKSLGPLDKPVGGLGEAYGDFIVNTLKPWVDTHYRTLPQRDHTTVAGSSMGGVISLYLGARYPEVFSAVGAFSTAAWFAQEALVGCLSGVKRTPAVRWYLDVGTEETSNDDIEDFNQRYIDGTHACAAALIAAGVDEGQIQKLIVPGAIHNERDWALRLPEALQWLMQLS